MSSKASSPTAQLLRSSRLFSLPTPVATWQTLQPKGSDTATASYPTQQALKTTTSSRIQGDWGLKRPLPTSSTNRGTNPVLRLNALDTREHITDFSSASDLTVTLAKFHELGLAVTTSEGKTDRASGRRPRSVFEEDIDNVTADTASQYHHNSASTSERRRRDAMQKNTRWKFRGPYLADLTEGEFMEYLARQLKSRRPAFMAYLHENLAQKLTAEMKQRATERGERGNDTEQQIITSADITPAQFRDYIQKLRKDFVANSELARLVENFLDLPASSTSEGLVGYDSRFSESGPPTTHPSAGLSYLRTDAYMNNHPLLGPQKYKPPVEGRNLGVGSASSPNASVPYVGVAGIVVKEPSQHSISTHLGGRTRSIARNDPVTAEEDADVYPHSGTDSLQVMSAETEGRSVGMYVSGGNRVWVNPQRVTVDSSGRIKMTAGWAATSAINVRTAEVLKPEAPKSFTRSRESYVFRPSATFDPRREKKSYTESNLWGKTFS